MMKTTVLSLLLLAALAGAQEQAISTVDPDTVLSWISEGKTFEVLDVRTRAGFVFIGHPEGAFNIPLMFWDPETGWSKNEKFIDEVKSVFPPDTMLLVICRSGGCSARATEMLMESGFTAVYNFS